MTQHWDTPVEGYYKRRMVRGGPYVPVHIARHCTCTVNGGDESRRHVWQDDCDRFPPMSALISGVIVADADVHWTFCMGNEINAQEYQHMLSVKDWAERHAPEDPMATPDKPIDPQKIPSLF